MIKGGNVTIYVRDLHASVAFYSDVLGLEVLFHAPAHFALLSAGPGLTIGLHPARVDTPEPGESGSVRIVLEIAGRLEAAIEQLRSRGMTSFEPIRVDASVRHTLFHDPDGHRLYLLENRRRTAVRKPVRLSR